MKPDVTHMKPELGKRLKKLVKQGYKFKPEKAEFTKKWIQDRCSHVKGELAGHRLILADYFYWDFIYPVFGLYTKNGERRLISECYIEIPKKNGKTTNMAGIELFLLGGDGEIGADIFNMAGDDGQANLLFRTAKMMVSQDDILKSSMKCYRSEIHYKNGQIKKRTAAADTKHGEDAHGVIIDELHVAERDLYETVKWAGEQRANSLFLQITTAGFDRTSICWDRHEYTRMINDGIIDDPNHWGVIYNISTKAEKYCLEVDKEGNFTERAINTWKSCNPIWEYSEVFRDKFYKSANEARNNITLENAFKRLRLNVWTGSEKKWISSEDWETGNKPLPDLTGMTCYGGLDLASTSDTTALVLCFVVDEVSYIMPFIFVPERMIDERDKRNESFYFKWAREGYLIRTPGNVIDYTYIEKKLEELTQTYNIISIGYDPFNARQKIIEWQDKFTPEFEEYRQGWPTMSEPTKEFERRIKSGKLVHGGHPVLKWMADNAMLRMDVNDNYMVGKGKISKDKVDGVVAAIISVGESIRMVEVTGELMVW